ncbi:MAG TPA: phage tail protein [Fimbriimonadaceae bacterium]|nr:phage tail protein [Fimbriimonadaceae bacterium]
MTSRFAALLVFAACSALSFSQSAFISVENPGSSNPTYFKISDFGMSRAHAKGETTQDNVRFYQPGRPTYGNLTFETSLDVPAAWHRWIKDTMDGRTDRKSVSVIFHNDNGQSADRYNFFECWPTRIELPGCDSTVTTPRGVKVSVLATRFEHGDRPTEPQVQDQKSWLPCNFRLKIDGLDDACARVNKIEALVIKQVCQLGGDLDGDGASDFTISDLVFTLPTDDAAKFENWYRNGGAKGGQIQYLDRDGSVMSASRMRLTCGDISFDVSGTGLTTIRCQVHSLVWSPRSN